MAMQLTSLRPSLAPASRAQRVARRSLVARAEQKPEVTTDDSIKSTFAGDISRENAEKRANLGVPDQKAPTFAEAQAFDGPAPETINGRLSMLGVTAALVAELRTGVGIREQVMAAPVSILLTFALISIASYVPISRGYTRKEPYSNTIWNPKSENWNGRLAMLGFTALVITEAISGMSTIDYYGIAHGSAPLEGLL